MKHVTVAPKEDSNSKQVKFAEFGGEQLDHITDGQMRAIFSNMQGNMLVETAQIIILRVAALVFNDANHPENRTCFAMDIQSSFAKVNTKYGWVSRPVNAVLVMVAITAVGVILKKKNIFGKKGDDLIKKVDNNVGGFVMGNQNQMRQILVDNRDFINYAMVANIRTTLADRFRNREKKQAIYMSS